MTAILAHKSGLINSIIRRQYLSQTHAVAEINFINFVQIHPFRRVVRVDFFTRGDLVVANNFLHNYFNQNYTII